MAEKGIKYQQEIDLQILQNRFQIDGINHPIKFAGPEAAPGPGISVDPYVITDHLGERMDVAKIRIEAGFATPIQLFKGDRWIQDFVLEGKGTFIGVDEAGLVHTFKVDSSRNKDFQIAEYNRGWATTWIADKDGPGLEFVEVCSPPWVPEYEKLELSDERIPSGFRSKYIEATS